MASVLKPMCVKQAVSVACLINVCLVTELVDLEQCLYMTSWMLFFNLVLMLKTTITRSSFRAP